MAVVGMELQGERIWAGKVAAAPSAIGVAPGRLFSREKMPRWPAIVTRALKTFKIAYSIVLAMGDTGHSNVTKSVVESFSQL